MMKAILNLKLGDKDTRCFIDSGSFAQKFVYSAYHQHSYAEIHIVFSGRSSYHIEKTKVCAQSGSVIFIPAGAYHCINPESDDLSYCALQVESDCKTVGHESLSLQILEGYLEALRSADKSGNYAKLSAWIGLICASVIDDLSECVTESTDYAYAINDFFARHYNREVSVCDLANHLCLSEKQTTRLVKKYTDKTFVQNLLEARMLTAEYLAENTDMPMTEIARHVGYNSYGGFFKAREKYLSEQ